MHLKINSKWELRYEKVSNYIPHKINRMVHPDSRKSKKYAQSYRKLETKTITAPQTGAFFHNDWMKSLFSMAVLNKHKMCMVFMTCLGVDMIMKLVTSGLASLQLVYSMKD